MNSPVPRRSRTALAGFVLALAFALGAAPALRADGFIIPDRRPGEPAPPLSVKFHRVKVEIDGQVARTSVDQVFLNPTGRDIEGTYIFPVPEGASVSGFAMFVGDRRIEGEVLSGAEARRTYEDIVRRMKDPGLLEYLGRGLFRARVYPIPARGEKRVQISYTEVLKAEGGLVRYLYPLATERFSSAPLEDLGVTVLVSSPVPVVNVYSPSHRVSVRREGPGKAVAGFEARGVRPDKDFLLYYSLSPDDVGLSFLGGEGPDGGHFLFLASPRFAAAGERVVAKDVVLVLDSSGSMSGTKIRQAKEAARFILGHLGREDAFTLVDFDDGVTPFTDALVPATPENVGRALEVFRLTGKPMSTLLESAGIRPFEPLRRGRRPQARCEVLRRRSARCRKRRCGRERSALALSSPFKPPGTRPPRRGRTTGSPTPSRRPSRSPGTTSVRLFRAAPVPPGPQASPGGTRRAGRPRLSPLESSRRPPWAGIPTPAGP